MQGGMMDCMGGMMNGGMLGGTMIFWSLFAFVLLIGLIGAAVFGITWLVRSIGGSNGDPDTSRETPQEILKRRLARGEITFEQFETTKQQLQKG